MKFIKNISLENKLDWHFINFVLFYLLFPLFLFTFGWLKLEFAILFACIVLYSAYNTSRQYLFSIYPISKIKLLSLGSILIIAVVWLGLSGIGGFGLQSWDFHGRNAIIHDLISHTWPVIYDYSQQPQMEALIGGQGRLVYYFAFFLPAALAGKVFGWQAANLFLFVWSLIGVLITIYLIFQFFKKISIWIILAFVLFSGMDFLASFNPSTIQESFGTIFWTSISAVIFSNNQIEWWAGNFFQYSSITTQLFNVFNQCIPAWIITLFILQLKDLKSIWFLYSLLLMYSPFSFIGLFPIVLYKNLQLLDLGISNQFFQKHYWINFYSRIKNKRFELMTFQNFAGGLSIILVTGTFLLSNAGNHEFGLIFKFHDNFIEVLIIYFAFCLVEFLILGLLVSMNSQQKPLLWMILCILLFLPFFKYGKMNDFVMRSSIPALLILFLISIQTILVDKKIMNNSRFQIIKFFIILVLLIGTITPLHEINRSLIAADPSNSTQLIMDAWESFDYGGYIDKMDSMKNFVVSDNPIGKKLFVFK